MSRMMAVATKWRIKKCSFNEAAVMMPRMVDIPWHP